MRAGMFVAYWPWFSFEEQVSLAVPPTRVGWTRCGSAEAWGQDAVSLCGYLAARTERIALGTALMQIPARPPAATAMAAATIDVMSGGRFRLGLGVSGPQVSEGWYGMPFARPVSRTREYVEIVRKALAGEQARVPAGASTSCRCRAASASRCGCWPSRCRSAIPIYLGAIGPKAVEQVGEIADGWLPVPGRPRGPGHAVRAAARRAGEGGPLDRRTSTSPPRSPSGSSEDIDEARAAVRPLLAFYLGAMGAKEKNFYVELADRAGFGDAAREVQGKWLARDHAGALAAVPDELVDRMARRHARRPGSTTAWPPTSARAWTRSCASRAGPTGRRSWTRWRAATT